MQKCWTKDHCLQTNHLRGACEVSSAWLGYLSHKHSPTLQMACTDAVNQPHPDMLEAAHLGSACWESQPRSAASPGAAHTQPPTCRWPHRPAWTVFLQGSWEETGNLCLIFQLQPLLLTKQESEQGAVKDWEHPFSQPGPHSASLCECCRTTRSLPFFLLPHSPKVRRECLKNSVSFPFFPRKGIPNPDSLWKEGWHEGWHKGCPIWSCTSQNQAWGVLHCTHPFMHSCTMANARTRAVHWWVNAGSEMGELFPREPLCTGIQGSGQSSSHLLARAGQLPAFTSTWWYRLPFELFHHALWAS